LATALTNEISSFLYINQFGSISTSFWQYPLKSVRRKALGWISYFTEWHSHGQACSLALTLSIKNFGVYPISLLSDLCNVDYAVHTAVLTTKYEYVQHKYAK